MRLVPSTVETTLWGCIAFLTLLSVGVFADGPAIKKRQSTQDIQGTARLVSDAENQLEEGRTTLDEQELMAARGFFKECTVRDSKNARCYYDIARTEGYLGRVKRVHKDKKAAQSWIDSAIENAQRAIVINDKASDAHALLADLYGNKIGLGGVLAATRYGARVTSECERALELDPNNPRIYLVLGRKYLFAPKMFGGSLDKAVESFQEAITLDPKCDEGFVWLAIAYRKKGDSQNAAKALQRALRLNPRSSFATRVAAGSLE